MEIIEDVFWFYGLKKKVFYFESIRMQKDVTLEALMNGKAFMDWLLRDLTS